MRRLTRQPTFAPVAGNLKPAQPTVQGQPLAC